jgi:deoxyadenosine/deoxycytidine kinase
MFPYQRIIFDGLIGAGKSTVLHAVKEYLDTKEEFKNTYDVEILYENVSEWIEDGSLEFSYENPKKGVFPLQIKSILSKCPQINNPHTKQTIYLTERSEFSAHYIFGEMHYKSGNMTPHEWKLCNQIYSTFSKPIDLCFFLDVKPELAMQRLHTRGRDAEKSVSIHYMNDLYQKYMERFHGYLSFPCIWIDADDTIEHIAKCIGNHIIQQMSIKNEF